MRALLVGASGYLGARVHRAAAAAGVEVVTAGRSAGGPGHVTLDLAGGPDAVGAVIAGVGPRRRRELRRAPRAATSRRSAPATSTVRRRWSPRCCGCGPAAAQPCGSCTSARRPSTAGGPAGPSREDEPARPLSPYGLTKLAGTRLVQLGRAAGLPAVVLRVFNPVGPGAPGHTLPGRAASELVRAVRENDVVRLGGLDAVRDFVDADDVAAAVLAAATGPVPEHGVVNVGSGAAVPARELVRTLVDVSGARVRIEEGGGGSARSADVPWQQADITAATAAWDWRPRTPLAVSLEGLWRQAA